MGAIEHGDVLIQLKATDHLTVLKNDAAISFDFNVTHLNLWRSEITPDVPIVYGVAEEIAYRLYVQYYCRTEV